MYFFKTTTSTMERRVRGFDMWHDYMDLGKLIEELRGRRDVDRRNISGPKKEPRERWSPSALRDECRNSIETCSADSLSDTSCSETSPNFCRFCKQNSETPDVYLSHKLKSDEGKVTCPVLWSYTCPICEATGDNAHTRRYCPQAKQRASAKSRSLPKFW
ncbi:nanos homolog 2-like [Mastacembelus armatus]|uniref:Nanos homolog 2 n=1 Tax=Mastacembelus armatus TaxID=205130 RepID=A0A3Q3L3Y9_9TELE|nr:nanos homolog 2-like [Mastacembelus armatus]